MTSETMEAQVIDAVIANAVHLAHQRAATTDVAHGLIQALRVVRDHVHATSPSDTPQIDDAMRNHLLIEGLQRRAINPITNSQALAAPTCTAHQAREILCDAARTCMLLDTPSVMPSAPALAASGLVQQLCDLLPTPPAWSDVKGHLLADFDDDLPPADTLNADEGVWLH